MDNVLLDDLPKRKETIQPLKLLTGAISGTVSKTLTNPFGRIKIFKQCRVQEYHGLRLFKALQYLWIHEGFKGLFKGNFVNCIKAAPFTACEFGFYDLFKRILLKESHSDSGNYRTRLLCGALTGMMATSITHPLDVIRTFLSFYTHEKHVARFGQRKGTIMHAAKYIFLANRGLIGFYRGWLVAILGITPHIAVKMTSFDFFKHREIVKKYKEMHGGLIYLPLGGVAGALAATVSYPFDLLRKRFQIKDTCSDVPNDGGIINSIKQIYLRKGIRGFYAGLTVNYWRVIPTVAIICFCNEYITAARIQHRLYSYQFFIYLDFD